MMVVCYTIRINNIHIRDVKFFKTYLKVTLKLLYNTFIKI